MNAGSMGGSRPTDSLGRVAVEVTLLGFRVLGAQQRRPDRFGVGIRRETVGCRGDLVQAVPRGGSWLRVTLLGFSGPGVPNNVALD